MFIFSLFITKVKLTMIIHTYYNNKENIDIKLFFMRKEYVDQYVPVGIRTS